MLKEDKIAQSCLHLPDYAIQAGLVCLVHDSVTMESRDIFN